MTYSELVNYIAAIEDRPSACGVRFGCDCGCGGDYYTLEHWTEGEARADKAEEILKAFGITFSKEQND